ncbi:hypothetical protein ACRAWD_30045 [Caulobacter segnis]
MGVVVTRLIVRAPCGGDDASEGGQHPPRLEVAEGVEDPTIVFGVRDFGLAQQRLAFRRQAKGVGAAVVRDGPPPHELCELPTGR